MLNYQLSDSGIPVYHYQMPNSHTCEVLISLSCGSAHEDEDSWGVAHFLEHLCFQGTPEKNKHQINREQSKIGNFNAFTSSFQTVYYFDSLNEDFEKGLILLKECIFDSNFPIEEYEKEKNVIIEEWRTSNNNPSVHFWNFLTSKCFGDKEAHPVIGTEDSIKNTNLEKIFRYRNKWYGIENISLIVVGNIELEKVIKAVNETFPEIKKVEKTKAFIEKIICEEEKSFIKLDKFDQAELGLITKFISKKDSFSQSYKSVFFQNALNLYLFENIRNELGLCYSIYNYNFGHYENQYLIIRTLTNDDYIEKSELEIEKLFNKIKHEGFPNDLFEICRKQVLYDKILNLQQASTIAHVILSNVQSSCEKDWFINEGNKILDIKTVKKFANDLKPQDLQEFAQNYLKDFKKFIMLSR